MLKTNNKNSEDQLFYTLSHGVYSVMLGLQESEARFVEYLEYAIDFARKHNIERSREVKVYEARMRTDKTIVFPKDMEDWVKVGVKCGNTVKTFTIDEDITKNCQINPDNRSTMSCLHIDDVLVGDDEYYFGLPFFDGGDYEGYKFFGRSVQSNRLGYFNVDWRSRTFNFKDTIDRDKDIYIEYITDGINPTGKTVIGAMAFRLLKLWILWQRKENNDRYGLGEKDRAERQYKSELMDYDLATFQYGLSDLIEALRSGYSLTPKN